MNKLGDRKYLRDEEGRWSEALMKKLLIRLVWFAAIEAVIYLVLCAMIFTTCTEIQGVSISGELFKSDSYTCPIEGVSPVYPHRADLLDRAFSFRSNH